MILVASESQLNEPSLESCRIYFFFLSERQLWVIDSLQRSRRIILCDEDRSVESPACGLGSGMCGVSL